MTVLINFPVRSTSNITEVEDPGGCEQTDSTDAEPEESPRLSRSPRRLHPASRRRSPVLRSEHVVAVAATFPHTAGFLLSGCNWPVALVFCFTVFQLSWLWSPSTMQEDVGDVRPGISISASTY